MDKPEQTQFAIYPQKRLDYSRENAEQYKVPIDLEVIETPNGVGDLIEAWVNAAEALGRPQKYIIDVLANTALQTSSEDKVQTLLNHSYKPNRSAK